jgi:hypothetical protein
MLISIAIQDIGKGVKLSGSLNAHSEQPTPAEIVGLYLASHPDIVAQQSWAWYAAKRVAAQHNRSQSA